MAPPRLLQLLVQVPMAMMMAAVLQMVQRPRLYAAALLVGVGEVDMPTGNGVLFPVLDLDGDVQRRERVIDVFSLIDDNAIACDRRVDHVFLRVEGLLEKDGIFPIDLDFPLQRILPAFELRGHAMDGIQTLTLDDAELEQLLAYGS
ncbi:hypothetical protein DOI34_24020 [Salmonella enterica subsp. enterica serovar Virchow]|nr:hypothetical protein [Salmonella enterica subsp. enterica serovar Virchow]